MGLDWLRWIFNALPSYAFLFMCVCVCRVIIASRDNNTWVGMERGLDESNGVTVGLLVT